MRKLSFLKLSPTALFFILFTGAAVVSTVALLLDGQFITAMIAGIFTVAWILWIVVPIRRGMWEAEREHRLRFGLCLQCGYNLRGTLGQCPECGAPRAPAEVSGAQRNAE
jgi:hypothetical protein